MPNPSFFDAIEANPGTRFAAPNLPDSSGISQQQYQQNLRLKAGLGNTWGTDLSAGYTPNTGEADVNFKFPIGSHQTGYTGGIGAFARPSFPGGPMDVGARIEFGKKILKQVDDKDILNRVSPDLKALLEQRPDVLKQMRNDEFNKQNNFNQSGNKFNVYGSVDTVTTPMGGQGIPPQFTGQISPQQFLNKEIQPQLSAPNINMSLFGPR